MFLSPWHWLVPVLLFASAVCVAAPPGPSPRPDPLDAGAEVPRTVYRSPLVDTARVGEAPAIPWREANDTVRRIGGWRAYAREAAAPAASPTRPAAAASAPPGRPAHSGHAGHAQP